MSIHNFAKSTCLTALCAAAIHLPLFADLVNPADYEQTFNVKFVGYSGTTTLTNFPALIRLSKQLNNFDYTKCTDGANLRFADSDGNLLPHEIDTWNSGGESLVWVQVPLLTRNTVIKVCYGEYNGSGDRPTVTATDVWTNGYVGVWHMNAATGSRSQADATVNGKTVTCPANYSAGVESGVAGKVGLAARCGLAEEKLAGYSASDAGYFNGLSNITVEAWTFRDAGTETLSEVGTIVENSRLTGSWSSCWSMYEQANNEKVGFWLYSDVKTGGKWLTAPSPTPTKGEWHYHARRWSGETGVNSRTLDDVTVSDTDTTVPDKLRTVADSTLCIGNRATHKLTSNGATINTPFHGIIDEVRISNVFHSDDWVRATHDTIANEAFCYFYTVDNPWGWDKYSHRFTIAFRGVPDGVTLTNFPVLVKVSATSPIGFDYANCLKPDGADLRFSDENGSLLASEVEIWNTDGESYIWVKVPTLTKSTKITGYYGWSLAPAVTASDVWDENYLAVWHMNAAEGSLNQLDSTANSKTVSCPSSYSTGVSSGVAGKVGRAARCGLSEDKRGGFGISDAGNYFAGHEEITIEAWTYKHSEVGVPMDVLGAIVQEGQYNNNWANIFSMYEQMTNGLIVCYFYSEAYPGGKWPGTPSPAPSMDSWHYNARRWNGTTGVYSMTQDDVTTTPGTALTSPDRLMTTPNSTLTIGNRSTNVNGTTPFRGDIDEVRISKVARSDAWINATYDTIANNATFTKYGIAKENRAWGMIVIVR